MLAAVLLPAAIRIALAIVLNSAAFVVWDIGTRSPARLLADARAGLADRQSIVRGVIRFATGAVALAAAAVACVPVVSSATDFTVVECWTLVVALIVEQLVGPDLRSRRAR